MHEYEHFRDRREAGKVLAERLRKYGRRPDVIVLGLPRGGVPVAYEVAASLGAPMDVFVVRKLGVPGCEELAMGAVAEGGIHVLNHSVLARMPAPAASLHRVMVKEHRELERRQAEYRSDRPLLALSARTVIVVDDGLATGATARAAVQALREHAVARCVVAVPVASPDGYLELCRHADEVACVIKPRDFEAVGQFYEDFSPTSDSDVRELMAVSSPSPA